MHCFSSFVIVFTSLGKKLQSSKYLTSMLFYVLVNFPIPTFYMSSLRPLDLRLRSDSNMHGKVLLGTLSNMVLSSNKRL